MKTLDELIEEFEGKTTIQQEEHLKKLIGVEVQVLGEIRNIDAEQINLNIDDGDLLREPLARLRLPYGTLIFIKYEKSRFGKQLLEYSGGDGVKMATRLTSAHFAAHSAHYTFDLLSILKLNTRDERVKAKKEVEQREAEQKKDGCFVATAAYGCSDPNVIILKEYRDRILSKSFAGRGAVWFYYLASPPLARFIKASDRRRSKARVLLRPLVLLARRQLDYLAWRDA